MKSRLLCLTIFPLLLSGCSSSSNISSYSELLQKCIDNPDFHSQLYVFPENTNIGTPTKFSYKWVEDLFTGSFLMYLVMKYSEETFNQELSRIEKVEGNFPDGASKKIIHFEEESIYLTINRDKRYEYVKYFKDSYEIAYVSNQLFSWVTCNLDSKHSLPRLTIPTELDDGDNSYNMYYHYVIDHDLDDLEVGIYVNC